MEIFLKEIAYARSGDKGSYVNIGLIAKNEAAYRLLERELTVERVGNFFRRVNPLHVKRHLWPHLLALNFMLEGALEGGGSMNLRLDAQGKTFGVALLKMSLELSEKEWEEVKR